MSKYQQLIPYCEECGRVLVRTPSGAVCPMGCGRIRPLSFLRHGPYPEARRVPRSWRYTLQGFPGDWRPAIGRPTMRSWLAKRSAKRSARRPAETRGDDWQIGRFGRMLLWFRPVSVSGKAPGSAGASE